MEKETFAWIWELIEPNISNIEDVIDADERRRLNFRRVYDKDEVQDVILQEYTSIRNELKAEYYKNQTSDDQNSNLIDHHKIAACFCQALLQKKVFTFDLDDSISAEMLLSNYKLAYTAGLVIVYLCMIDWYIYKSNGAAVEKLLDQKQLVAPNTTSTHAQYHVGWIKTLALNEHRGVAFDVLSYADMLFWIEYYNRQLLENSIEVEPYNPDEMEQGDRPICD